MISSKQELLFYIKADTMINRGYFKPSIRKRIALLVNRDIVVDFLCSMRKYSYYSHQKGVFNRICEGYYKVKFLKLSKKCGFSMGADCFGYGLLLNHYGTIVIGHDNKIGNFAAIYTSTCIVQNGSTIGDFFFMGSGSVISKEVTLGDNVKICANSVVNRSFDKNNIILGGAPAEIKKLTNKNWLEEYDNESSSEWRIRYNKIMGLKQKMNL